MYKDYNMSQLTLPIEISILIPDKEKIRDFSFFTKTSDFIDY
ncbi:hypothetical protein HMPREF1208_01125 [Staphylococcus sp. HGB0015]|uniref:IS1272 transposase n=1 Tax=Staphylococcus schleiferi TaxID=1295 RepID=A0A7Z7QP18_STASC|nr:hypothetical protein HMPREF1208_01125 [Staphylococcus sp. HGB0015]CAD7359445.1 IS1272 transposase [Staphylococcus schleiferi]SUM88374.1 IS1272 transposase [Staphylococcus schleiferi]